MYFVLLLHILSISIWLGVALLKRGGGFAAPAWGLSGPATDRSGLVVELPAFLVALLTGGYLACPAAGTAPDALKAAAGLLATGAALYALAPGRQPAVAVAADCSPTRKVYRVGRSHLGCLGASVALAISLHIFG